MFYDDDMIMIMMIGEEG